MLRRHRQLRTQISQLKDTALFAVALWLAYVVRSLWDFDVLGIASALYSQLGWEIFNPARSIGSFENFQWLYIILIPAVPLILEWQGFYNRPLIARRRDTAWRLFKATLLTTMGIILCTFFVKTLLARGVIVLFGVFSFVLVFLSEEGLRAYYRRRVNLSQFRRKFVLIGSPEDTRKMCEDLMGQPEEGIEVVSELDLNTYSVDGLIRLLHEYSASGVIINARHTYFGEIEKAIQACELEGLEAWLVADFFKTSISRISLDELQCRPMLVFQSAPEVSWQSMMKRIMDIIGALLFLVVFGWNLFLLFAILVKRSSSGPIFFRQKRAGLHGEPFTMLKFRTMVSDAEQRKKELEQYNEMSGPVFKVTNDPRVTRIGRLLRKFSCDEWPQIINVLKGEMSLVGPRPLPTDEVARFDDLAHRRRLSVKPGLTCLWQVSGRNNVRDFRDWVRLDLEYIDNWSLWLDFKILFRTIPVVLVGTGAK
jgi:exopolysaccharide biosynthesis polyprenyl glycosylphosphotransferase